MTRFLRYGLPPLLFAGLIFFLSSRPVLPAPDLPGFDKLAHLCEYGVFGLLLARGFRAYGMTPRVAIALAAVAASAYGVSDELHQGFVPGRSVEVLDWLSDTAGGAMGAAAWSWWAARARR